MTIRLAPRSILGTVLACAAGWLLHGLFTPSISAHAGQSRAGNTNASLAFELSGIGRETSLTVYSNDTHTLYVYPAVSQGSAQINCEFMLHLGRVGGPVQRENCQSGALLPGQ